MISHSYTPESTLVSTIAPIPKDTMKSLNDSKNYRSIALSSIIGKVYDYIIIQNNPDVLSSLNWQFAFKEKSSTTQCTFVVQETINYYLKHGSSVHAILLDATKAFDRVSFMKLFNELRNRGMCPLLCRFLAVQYTMQKCRVKWESCMSESFSISNGVKQGGVLSPVLFTVYMDCLLQQLQKSKVGCHIGHAFTGAFAYADDIILLAPTKSSMNTLLNICESFSLEYSVTFNASKSKYVFFGNNRNAIPATFQLQGNIIPSVPSDKHLGNWIGQDMLTSAINDSINNLYKNTNILMSQFSSADAETKYKLFKSYCMSVYGSQLWDYSKNICNKFFTAWRKCIRRLLGLPYNAHSDLLHLICDDIPVHAQLHTRFVKFLKSCIHSKNEIVHMCAMTALDQSSSHACNSWLHIQDTWNLGSNVVNVSTQDIKQMCIDNDQQENLIVAAIIKELLYIDDPDAADIIDELSTL